MPQTKGRIYGRHVHFPVKMFYMNEWMNEWLLPVKLTKNVTKDDLGKSCTEATKLALFLSLNKEAAVIESGTSAWQRSQIDRQKETGS